MIKTCARMLRHRWLDASDAARAVPPALSDKLTRQVAASESRHTGEVRICVEGGLPSSYLWRHLRDGVGIRDIVRQRALMMFSKLRIWDTELNNGVLIYVLLAERAIELVADRGVNRHVSAAEWQAMVERMQADLNRGDFEKGLERALDEVSTVMATHFPETDAHPPTRALNQLPDEPVLR